jgi:N-methylhydantoinase B
VTNYSVRNGDVLTVKVPGSGGYGEPNERDPEAVARDIAEGLITRSRAVSNVIHG